MCIITSKLGKLYDLTLPVLCIIQIKTIWYSMTHRRWLVWETNFGYFLCEGLFVSYRAERVEVEIRRM